MAWGGVLFLIAAPLLADATATPLTLGTELSGNVAAGSMQIYSFLATAHCATAEQLTLTITVSPPTGRVFCPWCRPDLYINTGATGGCSVLAAARPRGGRELGAGAERRAARPLSPVGWVWLGLAPDGRWAR